MRAIRPLMILCLAIGGLGGLAAPGAALAQTRLALNPQWVPYSNGDPPENAVTGGAENGHNFAVCRALAAGLQIPGKFLNGNCNVAYGGRGFSVPPPFDVLTGTVPPKASFWSKAMPPDPADIVSAANEGAQIVGVCVGTRAADKTAHVGKLVNGVCYYEFGGHEERSGQFEWLAAHSRP